MTVVPSQEVRERFERLLPGVDVDNTVGAVARIADYLDARALDVATEVVQSCKLEIPEYELMDAEATRRQLDRNLLGIALLTLMLREGRPSLSEDQRADLMAGGAEVAREPEPQHAVVRAIQLLANQLIDETLALAPALGEDAEAALSATFRIGFGVLAQFIEVVCQAFADKERADGHTAGGRGSLVADLVFGVGPDRFVYRWTQTGLVPAEQYRAVVLSAGHGDAWSPELETRLAAAVAGSALFGRVGKLGVVVCRYEPDDLIVGDLREVAEELTGRPCLVAAGPARASLSDIHESFSQAATLLEAQMRASPYAQRPDTSGTVPRFVEAARSAGIELTTIIGPLEAVPNAAELLAVLRAYLKADCSTTAAADALKMHRTTFRRRLQSVEETLGFTVRERWAEAELALAARDLAGFDPRT